MVNFKNILFDKELTGNGKNLGNLPEWNLKDLYSHTESKELKQDLTWLKKECEIFANDFRGKLVNLSANEFLACVKRKEKISNVSGRLISFAGLRYYLSLIHI